jgi:hypothetical protein
MILFEDQLLFVWRRKMDGDSSALNKQPSVIDRVNDGVRAVANGATFGLADVAAGALDAALHGGSVGDNITIQSHLSQDALLKDTAVTVAGNAVGAVATGYGVMARAIEGGARGIAAAYGGGRHLLKAAATSPESDIGMALQGAGEAMKEKASAAIGKGVVTAMGAEAGALLGPFVTPAGVKATRGPSGP